ncbi:STY4528 family pathogenicity island replication protein [Rodentibacter pneumotropicus]|uniref:STY4528 family pathogenicity island replication protein n=2 Tax=Rodentibacter TaxID=1960084 RepID=UPI00233060B8|nr:STY4528 family pathogenicity island replication protein [Rodentibacter pneumotropicus]MDC2825876.1 STY4528 family pathogenicity island replication protein [Rodentibacter pneumotropicus]
MLPENKDFQGLLFVGNRHETVPVRLLLDKYLTSRAKMAWQLIKLHSMQFKGAMFPSYDTLALWLSDRSYQQKPISRKVVSQTVMLLRLTRWLTLCETVRNSHGQILGNVYVMNDEPFSIADSLVINDDYLRFVEKMAKHRDPILRDVALSIVDEVVQSSDTVWHLVSHIEIIRERYLAFVEQQTPESVSTSLPSNLAQAIEKTQQKLLSSNRELSKEEMELSQKTNNLLSSKMELSKNSLSSNRELSHQNSDKSLILGLVPLGNSVKTQYSTSTINTQYSTSTERTEFIYSQLGQFKLSALEKQSIANEMMKLDQETLQAVIFEAIQRIQDGKVLKPAGYLFNLVKRANSGEFKPYLLNKNRQTSTVQVDEAGGDKPGSKRILPGLTDSSNQAHHIDFDEIRKLAGLMRV